MAGARLMFSLRRWLKSKYKGKPQQHFAASTCKTNGQVIERSYCKQLSDTVHRGKVLMDLCYDMTTNCENDNDKELKSSRVGGSAEFRKELLKKTFSTGVHGFLTAIEDGRLLSEEEQRAALDFSATMAMDLRPIMKMHLKPGSVNLRNHQEVFEMFAVWAIATNNPGNAVLTELTAIRKGTASFEDLISVNTEAFLRCVYSTLAATNFDSKPKWYRNIQQRLTKEINQVRVVRC